MSAEGEREVRGLVKVASLFHWSPRTLERKLDELPDAKLPPVYEDHIGYYAYPSEVDTWIRLNAMHAARGRRLRKLERDLAIEQAKRAERAA